MAAKGFVEEVGISCNLPVVGVEEEEDPELLVINDSSIEFKKGNDAGAAIKAAKCC